MIFTPEFLTLEDILEAHSSQLELFGGETGIRDIALLQSAVAMPAASFEGTLLHRDLFEMAAAYLYHIVQNHPFLDGNKRTGAIAALIFLEINGMDFHAPACEFTQMVLQVASGKMSKPEIALFLRTHSSLIQ